MKALIRAFSHLYPMAKRWLKRFPGGIYPDYRKELSLRHPLHAPIIPNELILPLQQHVGVPAIPTVEVGERVKKFQRIAKPAPGLSVPVHAPTSGTIKAIEKRPLPHPSGLPDWCIVIEPDGHDQAGEKPIEIQKPKCPASLKEMILQAGIVGMGGAGFPSWRKLPTKQGQVHTLLINGAECEPYITCDDLLMQTRPEEIIQGALKTAQCIGAEKIIVGIEDNKPRAIAAMKKAAAGTGVEIQAVPTVYPMGGQKQLTEQLTGIEIPAGTHAVDVGLLMFNVATVAAIHRAAEYHEPLISRMVTVTGEGLAQPMNIEALLGTPFQTLANLAQPKTELTYPLIMGGPMMGFEVADPAVPVIKTTNCILANPPQPVEPAMPCIRCGECMEACPVNLMPQQMYWHAHAHEWDKVEKLNLFDCIECGCCSFVCPSHIPLVQYYRHAKGEIRKLREEQAFQEHARRRHEAHLARLEREKKEKEERLKAKKAAVKKQMAQDTTTTSTPSARQRAIEAAKKRAQKESNSASATAPSTADKRKAAMEAARKRAAAARKAAETSDNTQTETTEVERKQAAAAAAKARAAALKAKKAAQQSEQTDSPPATEPSTQEERRKAAMEAAKRRAEALKAKKQTQKAENTAQDCEKITAEKTDLEKNGGTPVQDAPEQNTTPSQKDGSTAARRKAAMEAARKRAAALRAKKQQENDA